MPLPFADPFAADRSLLSEAAQANGKQTWRRGSPGKLSWGLKLNIGLPEGDEERQHRVANAGPPSPVSPNFNPRLSVTLDQDGRKVLLRRSRSFTSTSPPPSPTRKVRKFGVGDGEDDDVDYFGSASRAPTQLLTPTSPIDTIFPLSSPPPKTLGSSLLPSPAATLRRASSLSRLIPHSGPLRRRSTTALFRPATPSMPELQLTRRSSETGGCRPSAGWKRELGVLSEDEVEAREVGQSWQSCQEIGKLVVTNPDEDGKAAVEQDSVLDISALDAMDTDDRSTVGTAL